MGACFSNQALPPPEVFCKPRQPLNPTVFPGMVNLQQARTYIIARQLFSFSGNDYFIKDNFNTPMCIAAGKVFTMRDRAVFLDLNRNVICVVLAKWFSVHSAFYIYTVHPNYNGQMPEENQDGVPLFRYAKVEQKVFTMHEKMKVQLCVPCPNSGKESWIDLYDLTRPGVMSNNLMVFDAGTQNGAALLDRAKIQFAAMEEWQITVAPGVDPVLMFAVIMIADELRDKKRENNNNGNGRFGWTTN